MRRGVDITFGVSTFHFRCIDRNPVRAHPFSRGKDPAMDDISLCVALWLTGQVPLGIAIGYGIRRASEAGDLPTEALETPRPTATIRRLPLISRLRTERSLQ
jgi:hypothetical protein